MLHSVAGLQGYKVEATDGEVGTITDLWFDESTWASRYLVANAGNWMDGQTLLISPASVAVTDSREQTLHLAVARQQLDEISDQLAMPSSRGAAARLRHWTPDITLGLVELGQDPAAVILAPSVRGQADLMLGSCQDVTGYDVQARDGHAGQVSDFLVYDEDWSIRLMVVDTSKWWPGTDVLVATGRIARVSYPAGRVVMNMTRDEIRSSAKFDALNLG